VKVCAEPCAFCLFGDKPLLPLLQDRERKIQACVRADSYFVCHEATARGEDVMCRGWWDTLRDYTNPGRIAGRLGVVPSWRPTGPPTDQEYVATTTLAKRAVRGFRSGEAS